MRLIQSFRQLNQLHVTVDAIVSHDVAARCRPVGELPDFALDVGDVPVPASHVLHRNSDISQGTNETVGCPQACHIVDIEHDHHSPFTAALRIARSSFS